MVLIRNFLNVGFMTMLSRILGFARDIFIANILGTGVVADAFFAAFRFPNLFRRLFAEGVFNVAFIPIFTQTRTLEGDVAARRLAANVISFFACSLLVTTILAEIFMPQLMALFVPGFLAEPNKFDFAVLLSRICFPYLACMSLMAAYGAVLNGLGKFIAAALAPVLLNVVLLSTLVGLYVLAQSDETAAFYLSFGTVIGGIAQVLVLVWAAARADFLPSFVWPKWDNHVREFWKLALPAILTGGVTQINVFVGTIIASGAGSAISYLYFADRLYQLPLGIIGIAVGIVLLPALSSHLAAGEQKQAKEALDLALLFSMLLTIPAAIAFIAIGENIIHVLFEHGAFDSKATLATAQALTAFAIGLPAFLAIKIFQPPFFARKDTRTPAIFAFFSMLVNVVLSLILFPHFAHVGIAVATSAASWLDAILLVIVLMQRGHFRFEGAQVAKFAMIIFCSLVMGLALWSLQWALDRWFDWDLLFLIEVALLGLKISVGVLLYFALLHVTGTMRLAEIKRFISRPPREAKSAK